MPPQFVSFEPRLNLKGHPEKKYTKKLFNELLLINVINNINFVVSIHQDIIAHNTSEN